MSIFLSVYTQTHPNLPSIFSLLAICFHTDDFSHVLKSTTSIFSGRKVSKIILFSGQLDIVEFHEEDISRTKTREKNQGIFFSFFSDTKKIYSDIFHFSFIWNG